MVKKRMFLFILACAILLFGCAPARQAVQSPSAPASPSSAAPAQSAAPATVTAFLQDMLSWKGVFWNKIDAAYKKSDYAKDLASINAPDYIVTILPMYDILTITSSGNGRVEGKLMVSGIPAYKETSGSIITFGFDYTYPEDSLIYPAQSVEQSKGRYDSSKQTLSYEDTVTYNGKTLARTVIEIKKKADGAYLTQYIYAAENQSSLSCVAGEISKDSYTAYAGTRTGDTAFTYTSILEGETTLEQIKSGMTAQYKAFVDATRAEIQKQVP